MARFAVAVAGVLSLIASQRANAAELCQHADACFLEMQEEPLQSSPPSLNPPFFDLDCNASSFDNAVGACEQPSLKVDKAGSPAPGPRAPLLCDGPTCQSMPLPMGSTGSRSLSACHPLAILAATLPNDEPSVPLFASISGHPQDGFRPRIDRPPAL